MRGQRYLSPNKSQCGGTFNAQRGVAQEAQDDLDAGAQLCIEPIDM